MWSVLNIYLFFIQDISLKSGTLHTIVREKYTSYSCLRRGYFFYGGSLLFLYHMKKNDPWVIFKKKSLIFLQLECLCFSLENDPVIVLRGSLFFFTLSVRRNNRRISYKSILSEFVCLFYVFYHQQSKLFQLQFIIFLISWKFYIQVMYNFLELSCIH